MLESRGGVGEEEVAMRCLLVLWCWGILADSTWSQPPAAVGGPAQPPMNPPMPMNPMGPPKWEPPKQILGESVDKWIERLDIRTCKDPGFRAAAVQFVPMFGDSAKKALPKIVDRLNDPDLNVRMAALVVLTTIPVDDSAQQKRILDRLIGSGGLIYSDQLLVNLQVALACSRLGPVCASAIPVLASERYLKNVRSYEVRRASAEALGQVGRPDPKSNTPVNRQAIIALMNALKDESALMVRIEIVQSLIHLGPPDDEQDLIAEIRVLEQRTQVEPDPVLKLWLFVSLMRLQPNLINEKNLSPLVNALSSSDHRVRVGAAQCFAFMGPDAKSKAGALKIGLDAANSGKDEDKEFAFQTLFAVARMGKEASVLRPQVQALLTHPEPAIKEMAQYALDRIDGKIKD
ncbi:MAG: HEAT repeat domain-containing protein [Gemmataceae bacterium]|nr:HEAT repeat domain-containing protein [Gemmataceae bacterium]